jgi:hypothetical protein
MHDAAREPYEIVMNDSTRVFLQTNSSGRLSIRVNRDSRDLANLFFVRQDTSTIIELMESDTCIIQYTMRSNARLKKIDEILIIDSIKYLNEGWHFSECLEPLDYSSYYQTFHEAHGLSFKSAFPWFRDSLIFEYKFNGQTLRVSGVDSVYVSDDIIKDVNLQKTIPRLIEISDYIDSSGARVRDARTIYLRMNN